MKYLSSEHSLLQGIATLHLFNSKYNSSLSLLYALFTNELHLNYKQIVIKVSTYSFILIFEPFFDRISAHPVHFLQGMLLNQS
jgi:hypothetical protein